VTQVSGCFIFLFVYLHQNFGMDCENHDASGIGSGVTESDSARKENVEFKLDYFLFNQELCSRIV
jgi:hypothetical protein